MRNRRRNKASQPSTQTSTCRNSSKNLNLEAEIEYAPIDTVETIETHISRIFLTPKFAYKQKKPVNLGFVDYTTLKNRIFFAKRELSLNRRTCSSVYLDIQELRQKKDKIFMGFKGGRLVDVLVRMRRVSSESFLGNILKRKAESSIRIDVNEILKKVAKRLYLFHKNARTSKRISSFGCMKIYKENWDDNFSSLEGLAELNDLFYKYFKELEEFYDNFIQSPIFAEFVKLRIENGFIRNVHGDLRMEHIAVMRQGRTGGVCLMDCVEFDERYRVQDLYLDTAFLLMDFEYNDFFYESVIFFDYYKNYFNYNKSISPYMGYESAIMPFFKAYKAIVRTKIALLSGKEEDALKYFNLARFYFGLVKKPVVILNCGLSGTGKSAVSKLLSQYFYAHVSSSDRIRQDLYGSKDKISRYAPATNCHVYESMLEEGLKLFEEGRSIIFDATFLKRKHREKIIRSFEKKDCNFIIAYSKICEDKEEILLSRLAGRFKKVCPADGKSGTDYPETDYSEADATVYFNQKKALEEPSELEAGTISGSILIEIDASVELEERFEEAMKGIIEKYIG